MPLIDYLFVDNYFQLSILAAIVFIAGIARGCIGFGFSALVVASSSFWLEVKYVVVMVIIMELIASLIMVRKVTSEIDYKLLKILSISAVISSIVGVWVLANIDSSLHQIMMSTYLLAVALFTLFKFTFKKPINNFRIYVIGFIAGFYNGFAGIGGIFVAAMLTSSNIQVKNIRATMVVYFFIIEATFFTSAYLNNLYSKEVFYTSILLSIPMLVGIIIGSKLFSVLPEKTLKKIVLVSLLVLSIIGLIKTV